MLILKQYVYLMLTVAIDLYIWTLIIYIIAGLFLTNRYAGWYVFLRELCDPPLKFVRRITRNRLVISNFDLSPILLFIALQLLQSLLGILFF